jgi:hypothetical protein
MTDQGLGNSPQPGRPIGRLGRVAPAGRTGTSTTSHPVGPRLISPRATAIAGRPSKELASSVRASSAVNQPRYRRLGDDD